MTLHQDSFVFELTQRCNHDCLHCYNAWKNPVGYPMGELGTAATLAMLGKMLDETGAHLVSLSGGEPLLRTDVFEIIDFLVARGSSREDGGEGRPPSGEDMRRCSRKALARSRNLPKVAPNWSNRPGCAVSQQATAI